MNNSLWQQCSERLQSDLPLQQFNTWIRPLQAEQSSDTLNLYAPNIYSVDWVRDKYLKTINTILNELTDNKAPKVTIKVGNVSHNNEASPAAARPRQTHRRTGPTFGQTPPNESEVFESNIHPEYTFDNFVEGKSNQLARAVFKDDQHDP